MKTDDLRKQDPKVKTAPPVDPVPVKKLTDPDAPKDPESPGTELYPGSKDN